jgi:hypothetical protein
MRNVSLPNPAQPSDIIAALLQSLIAARQQAPVVIITPNPTGSTTYTYGVVVNSNGIQVPGFTTITNGPASLTTAAYNSISWSPSSLVSPTYDIYRVTGGTTQGLIATGLTQSSPGQALIFVDNGVLANGATLPAFNSSGTLAVSTIPQLQQLAASAPITMLSGTVFLTGAGVVAATLPLPIVGAPSTGGHDGAELLIVCTTAHAHTVTTPANGINGANHVITFSGTLPNTISLVALNGTWWSSANTGGTIS